MRERRGQEHLTEIDRGGRERIKQFDSERGTERGPGQKQSERGWEGERGI